MLGRRIPIAILVLACAAPAAASERRCQTAVARAGRRIFARSLAILASCQRGVTRAVVPSGTDCADDATFRRKRAAAAVRATRPVARACTDADVASLALGGDCTGAATVHDVLSCLPGSHDAEANALLAVTAAAGGPLLTSGSACSAEAARQMRRFAIARLALIQRCKRLAKRRGALPPGTDCAAEPAALKRSASLRTRAANRIASRCDADALDQTRFGPPCEGVPAGEELAQCLLAAADVAAIEASMAEHRDGSFCGDASEAIERRIDELLGQMTLAEKLEQMHGSGFAGAWNAAKNERLQLPGFGMLDGPRGVSRLGGHATAYPVAMARGATWDPALEERVGDAIGAEMRAKGASVLLAPTINILRHPRWGRAQETYGEDTLHLGRMGVGFIRGVQRHVIASAKHFAANTIENTRFQVDVSMDERTLREIYLPHFRMAVEEAHVGSVMSAYNKVNGQYCGENVHLLHDVLKNDWGFRGFVESDWILGTRSTVPSANAGLDIEMPTANYFGAPLADAVASGALPEAVIDAAVRRILRVQLCFRLDTDPPVPDASGVETAAQRELARELARKSIVLLENDGGALPLDRTQIHSLVVIGPLATVANIGDTGSSNVDPSIRVAPLDGIRAAAGQVTVTHVPGPTFSATELETIGAADAVVVVAGLTSADEGESIVGAGDRKSLGVSAEQDAMIATVAATNPRTVVVLEGGSAITMPWAYDVRAILMAWYPGQEGGTAIGEILFGDVNPSGKLPISFPAAEADLPPFDNVSLAVTYGYFHGYRWLDRQAIAPLFPFGFGLSYTTYQYANLTISPRTIPRDGRVRATVTVTNTGGMAGDEIVQLYVGYQGSRVERAVQDLKAFTRVHLEAGETRTVTLEVRARDLAFWDVSANAWEVERITYVARIGPSSRDLPLEGTFAVTP